MGLSRLTPLLEVQDLDLSNDRLATLRAALPERERLREAEAAVAALEAAHADLVEQRRTSTRAEHALAGEVASMAAHASQMTGADPDAGMNVRTLAAFLSLPEDVFALAFSTEWFVRRDAPAGTREEDVFAAVGDGGVEVS